MFGSLQGKRILVTGGARGMGESHAKTLAEAGASVVIGDVRDDIGTASAEAMRESGLDVTFAHLDVTSEDNWRSVLGGMQERLGGVDGLVNNAGIAGRTGGPEVEDLAAWTTTVAINQTGTYLGIRTVAPIMRESKGGSIVNISSVNGIVGDGDFFSYSATKAAVRLMTRSAAHKLAVDKIRVNSICPGLISTPMNKDEVDLDGWILSTPMQRMGQPSEISNAVRFLLSDDSSFMTGSDLVVDGGYIA